MKQPAIYILSNTYHTVFYTGVTSNLIQRIYQHRSETVPGFTQRYRLHKWVYFELFDDMESAITREKQVKKWRRDWKIALIRNLNPALEDLWEQYMAGEWC